MWSNKQTHEKKDILVLERTGGRSNQRGKAFLQAMAITEGQHIKATVLDQKEMKRIVGAAQVAEIQQTRETAFTKSRTSKNP